MLEIIEIVSDPTSATPCTCWLSRSSNTDSLHPEMAFNAKYPHNSGFQCTKWLAMHNCELHCIRLFVTPSIDSLQYREELLICCITVPCIHIPVHCIALNGCAALCICKGEQIIWNDGAGGEILAHCKHCFRSEHTVNTQQCLTRDKPQH